MYRFLGRVTATLSGDLLKKAFNLPLNELQKNGSHDFLYSLSQGVSNLSLGVVGVTIGMIADVGVLIFLTICIFIIDPVTATLTFMLFGAMAFLLSKVVGAKARTLGKSSSNLYITSSTKIEDAYDSYRTLFVRNQRYEVLNQISVSRELLAATNAELGFLPYISKYVIESGVFISGMIISAFEFILFDAVHAVAALTLFVGAGTRIAPAMLRIQQGVIQLQTNLGSAHPTIDLVGKLENTQPLAIPRVPRPKAPFSGDVQINHLQFKYKTGDKFTTDIKELTILNGEFVAIVGKSGSGKSTLVDLIMGVFSPQYGTIRISGMDPQSAIEEWPAAMAYVPQNVHAIRGTLRENVAFGYPVGTFSDEEIFSSLDAAELSDFVTSAKEGLDSMIGLNGKFLSGGERQRLGIARALLGKPKIMILDEATSSLDSQTEDKIGRTLSRIQKETTLIVVAHRLSTVKAADRLFYIENGSIIASGTFEEVKEKVPDFESQSRLLGL